MAKIINRYLAWFVIFFPTLLWAENDPCRGENSLINIIDRPSFADSACTVPSKHFLVESGYQYQKITVNGTQQNGPATDLRLGLPYDSEVITFIPNYIHQTMFPHSGWTTTIVGLKHRFFHNEKWMFTGEGYVAPPSGSKAFGSAGTQLSADGLINYTINEQLSWFAQFGLNSVYASELEGEKHYLSLGPDFVFTYNPTPKLSLYGELYGQSKTAQNQGSGFNGGGGLIYLINKTITVDIEFYQRIFGQLGGFEHYMGVGVTKMLV